MSHLVLAEALWVLDAVYDRTAAQIAAAVDRPLNHKELTIQDAEVLADALEHFKERPVDRNLSKLDADAAKMLRQSGTCLSALQRETTYR